MYELSRVRLHSIGPKGARYQDVVLDLREVGAPVPRPAQQVRFDLGAGPLRRPSPATVLFLENGGGKSVLIKLIFSVMLPGRRNVVGTTSTRILENFVLAGDLAQVALEWQHTRTGDRVITGKLSEWRGHVVSTDPNRLVDLWYTVRPTARFNLDNLPLTVDGRLVTLAGFRERLLAASKAEPRLQAAWETSQGEWVSKLESLGLDPELFRYQRAMNTGEGEAADAFTFRSDQAFVEFLLRVVTQEDDPRGLADVIAGYAARLRQRSGLLAERDFVAGALELLAPLADARRDAEAAAQLVRGARGDIQRLAAALTARHEQDTRALTAARAEHAALGQTETAADQEVRRLGSIVLELRRLVAGLRLAEAQRIHTGLQVDQTRAAQLLEAWQATTLLVDQHAAEAVAESLRELVAIQQEQALPALRAWESAASRFAAALSRAAVDADQQRAEAESQAEAFDAAATRADAETQAAIRRAVLAQGRMATAQRDLDALQAALTGAVTDGLLVGVDQIAAAAAGAAEALGAARQRLAHARDLAPQLARERKRTALALEHATRAADQAAERASRSAGQHAAAFQRAASLAGSPRLAELLGVPTIDLDTDGAALDSRLVEAIAAAETERAALTIARTTDARILTALGTGGLLPPSEPVLAAVAVLERAGITAWPGWRYLAQLGGDDREATLRLYPHLVDGLVLNSPEQLDTAEELLAEARLLPLTIIGVGTTAAIAHRDAVPPAGLAFLVPPNPALYDEEAAQRERDRLLTAQAEREAQLAALDRRADADRALLERLRAWRADFPPGALDRLRAAAEQAEQAATQARDEADVAQAAAGEAVAAEDEHQANLPGCNDAVDEARRVADRLGPLAQQAAQAVDWAEQVRVAREETAAAERDQLRSTELATGYRQQANQRRDQAGDHRRIRDASYQELSTVAGAVDANAPVPDESLAQLRERYGSAREAYRGVEVGADLLTQLRHSNETAAAAQAAVASVPEPVRQTASYLLLTPDGADAAGRAAATARVRREFDALGERLQPAAIAVGRLEREYQDFIPQDRLLDPYGKPVDIAHGERLIVQAGADLAKARVVHDRLSAAREALGAVVDRAEEVDRAFAGLLDSLGPAGPHAPAADEAEPFPGTPEQARIRRDELRAVLTEAETLAAEAETAVRGAADALAQYAADPRFEPVTSPVRRQIVAVNRQLLPDHAADWHAALRPRLRSLDDDLGQINEHRAGIIARLHGLVDLALATLRSAQRLSRLPAGLGDWSGQEFLRVRFDELEPSALRERLGQVVDEAADAPEPRTDRHRANDGMTLLLRGVHAAMPKGVVVDMLKPDAVLRTERVRVARISDVFSGGQLLTAAIILYCTMAAVRANDRGRTGRQHAGVLFLDNPIGRASAGYLLELQLAVAEALGVQLVYTTGLFDTNALAVFPLVVRLRNDADLRAGLKYLSIDSQIRRPLENLGGPDDTGRVTASRIFVRPRPAGES